MRSITVLRIRRVRRIVSREWMLIINKTISVRWSIVVRILMCISRMKIGGRMIVSGYWWSWWRPRWHSWDMKWGRILLRIMSLSWIIYDRKRRRVCFRIIIKFYTDSVKCWIIFPHVRAFSIGGLFHRDEGDKSVGCFNEAVVYWLVQGDCEISVHISIVNDFYYRI